MSEQVAPPAPEKKNELPLDNIHDVKATLRKKAMEKYNKALEGTGRYKDEIEKRAEERAYAKKLAETGAVGMTKPDQEAIKASQEFDQVMREIDQYNPTHEESKKVAQELGVTGIQTDKVLEGMGLKAETMTKTPEQALAEKQKQPPPVTESQ